MHTYSISLPIRFILTVLAAAACFTYAPAVSAQVIEVEFENEPAPLFSGMTGPLMPGDTVSRSFTVKNSNTETETVYLRTLNDRDTNDLADALMVSIRDADGSEVYGNQLSDLFSRDNKSDSPSLGDIAPGEEQSYDFVVIFAPQAGNTYQDGTATFDLCVGFDGGNENCITGTGDPGDGDDGDGGGGNNSDNPDNDDDPLPGEIAGESTSTAPVFGTGGGFPLIEDFIGSVFGITADDAEATTTVGEETGEVVGTETLAQTSAAGANFFESLDCTFLWLALIAFISISWSVIEDFFGRSANSFRIFFIRNAAFTIAYVLGLILFQYLGLLAAYWWVFAGAWVANTTFDYFGHARAGDWWHSRRRNLYFGLGALAIIAGGYLLPLLCFVWWPFLLVLLASIVLFFFDT